MSDRTEAASPLARRLLWIAVLAAMLPILVATARAGDRGWTPLEDDALITIRVRDVLTEHHPLLGTQSSASLTSSTKLNHPGPLLFDALALPTRVLGADAGIPIGVAIVNCLAIIGIACFVRRRGGTLLAVLAMAVTAVLCWSMGSEVLFEPWNPHVVLLPFLFFLVLAWSVSCGDLWALPWGVGVGSLVLQTHLSYVLLLPALGVTALVGLVLWLRRAHREHPDDWGATSRQVRVVSAVSVGVALLCWIQPIIEQLTSAGDGNVTRLVNSSSEGAGATFGWSLGVRLVASVLSEPPFWFRPSFTDDFLGNQGWHPRSLTVAIVTMVVLAVVLGACLWVARRAGDRVSVRALVLVIVAIVVAVASAQRYPVSILGITPHVLRWLWPIAAFMTLAILATVLRRFEPRLAKPMTAIGVLTAIAVLFAFLSIPRAPAAGPNALQFGLRGTHELDDQLTKLEGKGPILVDDLMHQRFGDPYGNAMIAALQSHDIPFVVRDAGLVRQYGDDRRYDGHNARAEILMRTGDDAGTPPRGSHLVARTDGLTRAGRRERTRLADEIVTAIAGGDLRLDARGRAALTAGKLPTLARALGGGPVDRDALFASGELQTLVDDELLADGPLRHTVQRWAELERRFNQQTVALFVRPLDVRPASGDAR